MATDPRQVRVFDPPAFEIVRGERRDKVSPSTRHAIVQMGIGVALAGWASGRGKALAEWDIDLTRPGEKPTHLRPDLAYASNERLAAADALRVNLPKIVPELIVEVRSPNDREREIAEKLAVYLDAGTSVVILADPDTRTFRVYDRDGTCELHAPATFEHPSLPGLRIDLAATFAGLDG